MNLKLITEIVERAEKEKVEGLTLVLLDVALDTLRPSFPVADLEPWELPADPCEADHAAAIEARQNEVRHWHALKARVRRLALTIPPKHAPFANPDKRKTLP